MRRKNHALFRARFIAVNRVHIVVEAVKSRMRQPCFVKVQNVDLAVELRLDHFVVIDNAVIGRLRDRHDPGLGLLVLDKGIGRNLLFNRLPVKFGKRNRSDDAVMVARGHQKDGDRTGERNGVQDRLMTVAVHDHDVARSHGVVPDDLVGS